MAKTVIRITESELNQIIESAAKEVIKEGFLKNAAYTGLGALGLGATMAGNAMLSPDDEEDPMEINRRETMNQFDQENLDDQVRNGDISFQDAVDKYKNKLHQNESKTRDVIRKVISEMVLRRV